MLLGIQFTVDNLVVKRREVSWTLTKKLRLLSAGPGEIKRREVSWTLTKKLRLSSAGPGEIKRREVSWTLTKKLRLSFAGPGEIKRRVVVPGGRAQKRSRTGRWSWAQKLSLTCLLLQSFLNSSATDIVLVTLLCTAVETAIA